MYGHKSIAAYERATGCAAANVWKVLGRIPDGKHCLICGRALPCYAPYYGSRTYCSEACAKKARSIGAVRSQYRRMKCVGCGKFSVMYEKSVTKLCVRCRAALRDLRKTEERCHEEIRKASKGG